jgi:hypothetical protein
MLTGSGSVVLAASGGDPGAQLFAQYGALGVLSAIGIWLIRREAARADRAEKALSELNIEFRRTYDGTLGRAAEALIEATRLIGGQQR